MMVKVRVEMQTETPCEKGKRVHNTSPNNHFPVNDCRGVKGTAKRHMTTSDTARLRMKKFVTVCMARFLTTTMDTKRFPKNPRQKMMAQRNEKPSWTGRVEINFCKRKIMFSFRCLFKTRPQGSSLAEYFRASGNSAGVFKKRVREKQILQKLFFFGFYFFCLSNPIIK